MKNSFRHVLFFAAMLGASCSQQTVSEKENSEATTQEAPQRIVCLNGAVTEIVAAAGLADQIVGVDVTSTYPDAVKALPKIGYNMDIQAEGVISLNPTLIIGNETNLKPEVKTQFEAVGAKVNLLTERSFTISDTKTFIEQVCNTIGKAEVAHKINTSIDSTIALIPPFDVKPKVLFIYSRGAGMNMVAGEKTQMDAIIKLAGAENAVSGFESFKPLTPEALVEANPDFILMFDSGVSSLEGIEGALALPGMNQTKAGKNKAIIQMDGPFISNFGPRVGLAALALNRKLQPQA